MGKIFNKLFLKKIRSFDTITTKLLLLVLFSVLIPLVVISNLSINIISQHKIQHVQEFKKENELQKIALYHSNTITYIAIASLFVAIFFAILFSRKITTPILTLSKAAIKLAKGDLSVRINVKGKDEIARLGRTFNNMAQNLETQQRLRDNFIAALTHDLKVPMLAENQTIDYMLKGTYGPVTEEQQEVLELIKSTNNSSLEMVCNLLDVYKYDMGQAKLIKTDFNIVKLLNSVIKEVHSLATEKNILIHTNSNCSEIIVNADKKEVRRVIYNILSNAINNSHNDSEIECNIEQIYNQEFYDPKNRTHLETTLLQSIRIKNSVIISIMDNGVGVSKSDIPNLFKRFSLNKGRSPSSTGIGLYFSYQVAKKHNGFIWAESTKGQGSTFKFLIPSIIKEV